MTVSKEMKMKLKMTYAKIIGDDDVTDESNDSNIYSESDDNNEHAYNGFAGLDDARNVIGA